MLPPSGTHKEDPSHPNSDLELLQETQVISRPLKYPDTIKSFTADAPQYVPLYDTKLH